MATIEQLKASLRLMDTGDAAWDATVNAQLQGYLDAATSYVKDAVGCDDGFATDAANESLFDVAIIAIAGAYQQNPVAVVAGSAMVSVNLVANSIIAQLRGRWEVSQDGTTSDTGPTGSTDPAGSDEDRL
ncbi:MAG: head-tail connector protein [Lactobacillus sp.]|jgi:uncharacterized phage protein (predicted DNA packaging)|nr:head-tail connector protein [Lactobacillus sp.]MCI2032064.1 head-tail connector protein [Lactobacillus sp.]